MPAKVQLKLLSNSGELLNVANCSAGKISVLRASTPSDLRPYQRALGGSSGKDNLEILCDGTPFQPDEHTLIGFGEPSPTIGMTVKDFASSRGISELALASQLLSVGLEDVIDKRCAELTLDQEARLRILTATADPEKVIVLNDPFENISAKWRERVAELLAEFTRTRNALVIIPSLSYRPEAWISNQCVERIEVGQTSQRTIGFGSAGSESNAQIAGIRDQLRSDPRFAGQVSGSDSRSNSALLAAGVAAGIPTDDLTRSGAGVLRHSSLFATAGKLFFAIVASSVGGWAIFTAVSMYTGQAGAPTKQQKVVAMNNQSADSKPQNPAASNSKQPDTAQPSTNRPATEAALTGHSKPTEAQSGFLLDSYPALIKASILDTARGAIDFQTSPEQPAADRSNQKHSDSGNLFSLLEAAGNSKSDPVSENSDAAAYPATSEDESESVDGSGMTPEEAQREAIRNRFLEAIKASAERRNAEAQEQMIQ
jgi:hypothetical protein